MREAQGSRADQDWRRPPRSSRYSPPRLCPEAPAASEQAKKKKKKAGGGGSSSAAAGPEVSVGLGTGELPEDGLPAPPAARSDGRARAREAQLCFNCGIVGHFRADCPAPPRCPLTLEYLGNMVDGGFFYINMPLPKPSITPHLATITVVPDQVLPPALVVTAEIIAAELREFIGEVQDSSFTWEVRETAPSVFSVPFPSAEMLRLFTRFDEIPFRLHKFMVTVKEASSAPGPDFFLSRVWISISGLPKEAKLDHILKMVSEPVGKMVAVDVGSLEGDGPARIQILCPDPARVDGLILPFYFDTDGVRLTFELDAEDPEVVMEGSSPRPSSHGALGSRQWRG